MESLKDGNGPLRFADILTTASAVANYQGVPDVTAAHVLHAVALLQRTLRMEDLGRPLSPLVRRGPPGSPGGAEAALKALVQRWFAELGSADAGLDGESLARFVADLEALAGPAP